MMDHEPIMEERDLKACKTNYKADPCDDLCYKAESLTLKKRNRSKILQTMKIKPLMY
jgi:hypothetical protein